MTVLFSSTHLQNLEDKLDKLRELAKKRGLERKRKEEEENANRRKRIRGIASKSNAIFEDIQESQCLQDSTFVTVRQQNVNKFPKLTQESYANVFQEKSEGSTEEVLSPSAADESMFNFFKGNSSLCPLPFNC